MSFSMGTPRQSQADRFARLQKVLSILLTQQQFTLEHVRQSLSGESPRLLTRVIRDLLSDGHLREIGDHTFCWACDVKEFPAQTWLEQKVYTAQLPQTPAADRPRERLLTHGAPALRTAELLAILIRSGRTGESALLAGEKIAARYAERLDRLPEAGQGELKAITAVIGETAYCQIMAAIELGRRVMQANIDRAPQTRRILGSEDAVDFCKEHFARLARDGAQEEFHVVCLDTKHQVLSTQRVSVGSLDQSLIHPREVFRPAIKDAAKAVIVVHNHPSGDPMPSAEDLTVTSRMEEAGKTVGIQLLDHIIVARNGTVSIRAYRGK
jgi:DNA repair protein RadC